MASFAVHYVTVNGKMYAPGERIEGITDEQWKNLMRKKAIRSEFDAGEVVDLESGELGDEPEDEPDGEPVDEPDDDLDDEPVDEMEAEPDDELEAAELTDIEMPDMSGADSVVAAPRGRRKKGG